MFLLHVIDIVIEYERRSFYHCFKCGINLTHFDEAMSTSFRGRTGSATLFRNVVNVILGPMEDSRLSTGLHVIRVVYCSWCLMNLGWYYETAFDPGQKYKEGHYILEDDLIKLNDNDTILMGFAPNELPATAHVVDDSSSDDSSDDIGQNIPYWFTDDEDDEEDDHIENDIDSDD